MTRTLVSKTIFGARVSVSSALLTHHHSSRAVDNCAQPDNPCSLRSGPPLSRLLGKRGTSTVPHTHVGCIARFGEQLRLSRSGGFHLSRLQSNGTRVGLSNLCQFEITLTDVGRCDRCTLTNLRFVQRSCTAA